jgi:hypothetical protein
MRFVQQREGSNATRNVQTHALNFKASIRVHRVKPPWSDFSWALLLFLKKFKNHIFSHYP